MRGRDWGALFVLCGALFLDALDVSMKGVALPSIGADLAMGSGSLQWVVGAYTLGFGGFLLLGGRVADLAGRRRVFIVSLVVFVAASALGGLAGDGTQLIIARFGTGVSAAFTAPAGLSIITTTFEEGPARNRALALYSATGASGFSFGLVAGGALTEVGWRWVFLLPVVLAAVTVVGALVLIPPQPRADPSGRLDVTGAVTVTASLLALDLALVRGFSPAAGAFAVLAVALGAVFLLVERRSRHPLVRLAMLRSAPLLRANAGAVALLGGWVGALFILTLYLQQQRGWSPLATGLAVAPTGVVVALLAPRIAVPLVTRFGHAPVILAGLCSAALAYVLLLPIGRHTAYPWMVPSFLLVGAAFALSFGPLTMAATAGVAPGEQGVASGLVNTSFQIGPALTLAVVAAVVNTAGLRAALLVPLVVSLAGIAVTATGLRSPLRSA